jgi:hypothetical protein
VVALEGRGAESRVRTARRLGRLHEAGIVTIDDDDREQRHDLSLDALGGEAIAQRCLEQEPDAALGLGDRDVERSGGHLGGALLHLDEHLTHLRPVAVHDDDVVIAPRQLDEPLRRPLGVPALLGDRAVILRLEQRVAAERNDGEADARAEIGRSRATKA